MSNRQRISGDPAPGQPLPPEMQRLVEDHNEWARMYGVLAPTQVGFQVSWQQARADTPDGPRTERLVRLIAIEATGPHVLFLAPDLADQLAALLTRYALEARTGLVTG